jgi:hypothetical protein
MTRIDRSYSSTAPFGPHYSRAACCATSHCLTTHLGLYHRSVGHCRLPCSLFTRILRLSPPYHRLVGRPRKRSQARKFKASNKGYPLRLETSQLQRQVGQKQGKQDSGQMVKARARESEVESKAHQGVKMMKTFPQSVNLLFSPEEVEARERDSELGSKVHQ